MSTTVRFERLSPPRMPRRLLAPGLLMLAGLGSAHAGSGIALPQGQELWPSLSARVTVQAAAVSPLKLARWGELQAMEFSGGAVLGDYVFAQPSFGSFRATSGLVFGQPGQMPQFGVASYAAGSRLGLALGQGSGAGGRVEAWQTTPYLGLGFSSALGDSSFSLSADLGLLAEPAALGSSDGLRLRPGEAQRRELRVSPLLQLGVRYSF